ncbi:hypothetical protein BDV96DRAFT_651404 [Lophiotrema nucula]|uniref:Uncharacterized protein n=1 Tax=Lophiotrema nucula TaxID=690887 RepID=A0A6A5YTJ1_9PLEO|nr:hypothetical protein BDV96DRAFT_651404 [Lophiotrema nucula]
MAPPDIYLREFQREGRSECIPGRLVQTIKELDAYAFETLCKDKVAWEVHFHLQNDECEGEIDEKLWDRGSYLDHAKNGKLYAFAHFVARPVRGEELDFAQVDMVERTRPLDVVVKQEMDVELVDLCSDDESEDLAADAETEFEVRYKEATGWKPNSEGLRRNGGAPNL